MKKIITCLVVVLSVTGFSQNYDSISFETPTSKIIIDAASNNTWQIGTPGKIFFESAHSEKKAILTDSINSYPPKNTSIFIYVISNPYTVTCFTSMEFWHKYDMDTLTDTGTIEASYDGGNSWIQVNDTSEVSPWGSHFWWDSDYHESSGDYSTHPITTTGKSDGWIQSRFNWQWYFAVKTDTIIYPPDSLMIRFTFISDSVTTNKEGWMIDDIVTASAEWQDCSAIKENASDIKISIFPNPTSGIISIKFDNEQMVFHQLTVYDISGQIILQKESRYVEQIKINLTEHQPGIYFYLLKNTMTGEMSSGKIIKK